MTLAGLLDHAAVFIFALTGALTASRAQLDLVGFGFLACLTAVGGGTIRDLLLDRNPVFWIATPSYLALAVAAAVLIFFTAHLVDSRRQWLTRLDAAALSVAVPAGVAVALDMGHSAPVVLLMGVATGTFGGLMRDVVANEVPLVLRQGELYLTAAFAGAAAGLLALHLSGSQTAALTVTAAVTLGLRLGSLRWGWRLPVYRPRPPRG